MRRIFYGMRARCNYKKQQSYKHYGAKGIRVEWKNFNNFYEDMRLTYMRHTEKHGENDTSIDRIKKEGNYNKKNCRWATHSVQMKNRDYREMLKKLERKVKK